MMCRTNSTTFQTEPNIILDTFLDNFMKNHNYTLALPILQEVKRRKLAHLIFFTMINDVFQACGDIAEDAMQEIINSKAFKAGVERLLSKYEAMKKQE